MPNDLLLQYGALGFMVLASGAIIRALFQRETAAFERERARADRMEAEVQRLNGILQDKMLPILHEATKAISEVLQGEQQQRRDRRESR
jgi:biopolymer transport protein ExbB/TolQ